VVTDIITGYMITGTIIIIAQVSVFILADAIARVFTGLDSTTLKDLSSDTVAD